MPRKAAKPAPDPEVEEVVEAAPKPKRPGVYWDDEEKRYVSDSD